MTIAGPVYIPPPVIVTTDDNCTHDCAGTASQNWTIFVVGLAAVAVGLFVAWYGRRFARIMSGSTNDLDWPGWTVALVIGGLGVAFLGLVLAVVAWIILMANGWLTVWTVVLPLGALVYGVRRGERYIAAKRGDR